jgi:glycosyltransferase involved in cell wall biosynthesis
MTQPSCCSDVVVVIPAYRAAPYLDTTLASVAGQTVPPREVVVVDDGSEDGTAEGAKKWCSRLPLRVIVQDNAGPAAARRKALAESDSSLVALLDADDVWLPDHLASLTAAYREGGGLISADAFEWIPGHPLGRTRRRRHPIPPHDEQPRRILEDNFVFVGALFARSDCEAVGGFRDGFSGAEDWDLWIRLIRSGIRVAGPAGATMLYRLNSEGLTSSTLIYDRYIAVLTAAASVCTDADEMRLIDRQRSCLYARAKLAKAYDTASNGKSVSARRLASRALGGPPKIALQALGLVAAPRSLARLRDRALARSRRD